MGKKEQQQFLVENAKKDGIQTTASGLQYKVVRQGEGKQPTDGNAEVEVHYEGTLINGNKFDSSYDRGDTTTFFLNQVVPGWTEGIQLMNEGGEFVFYIPSELGYGERGHPGVIPPHATLIFKVELMKVW